jgi:hypothetical protein
MNDHGFLLMGIVEWQNAQDRPAIIGVVVGNTVYNPPNPFGDNAGLVVRGVLAWEKGAVRLSSSLIDCDIQSTCNAMIKKYIKDAMHDEREK